MSESISRFLEFNGKTLLFQDVKGVVYVAIKPICEALGVNYKHQHSSINQHPILGPASCNHGMQVVGDQLRNYFCLPERYVYGWLFSVRSDSPELLEYQRACYDILFDHFNGKIGKRKEILQTKASYKVELEQIKQRLRVSSDFLRSEVLQGEIMRIGKELKDMDANLEAEQMTLFN